MRFRQLLMLLVIAALAFGCQKAGEDAKGDKAAAEAGKTKEGEKAGEAAKPGEAGAGEQAATADEAKPADDKAEAPAEPATDEAPDEAPAADAAAVALPAGSNPYLVRIPSDTPYFWLSHSTVSFDKMPISLETWAPLYEKLGVEFAKEDPQGTGKILAAIMKQFQGNMSKEGLESLGFSTEPHYAIYGVGAFPVMRMQLGNSEAFEAMIGRVEAEASLAAAKKTFGNVAYREWTVEEVKIAAAVLPNNELVLTAYPEKAGEWLLPYAFGDKLPAESLATTGAVAKLAGLYGMGDGVSVGLIDVIGIVNVLTGARQSILTESLGAYGIPMPIIEGACASEFAKLATAAPRFVYVGYLAGTEMLGSFTLEITDAAFLSELKNLRVTVPGLGGKLSTTPLAAMGMGVDVKNAIDWAVTKSSAIDQAPFQCESLQGLNEMAREVLPIGQPGAVPPFVTGLKGFFVVLDTLKIDPAAGPSDIKAMAVLKTESPTELWGMVQPMLGPVFANVALKPDASTVALPAIPEAPFLEEMSAIMTDNTIGLSLGKGVSAQLPGFVNAEAPAAAPLLVFGYDYARFFEVIGSTMPPGSDKEMFDSMAEAYKQLGFAVFSLSVVDQGVQMGFSIEFKR